MDDFTTNMDAIEFTRHKLQELPEMSKDELETLKKEVLEWCNKNKYTILNAGARYIESDLLPDIDKALSNK